MENIRASEVKWGKNRRFFGFSRFLMFVLVIAFIALSMTMVAINTVDTALILKIWPAIVAVVLGVILVPAFLVKRKWVPALLVLGLMVYEILLMTGTIPTIALVEAMEAYKEAHSGSLDGCKEEMIKNYLPFIVMSVGTVLFVFTIISVAHRGWVKGGVVEQNYIEKVHQIAAEDPQHAKRLIKKFRRRMYKFMKKYKPVEFAHEFGVLCILDDPALNDKYFLEGESKFSGNVIVVSLLSVLWGFLSVITLGIMVPFCVAWKEKYYAERTVYSGKKIKFDGNGAQLFGRWMLWWFLSIITLGIYGFFTANQMKKWVIKHQHIEGEEEAESKWSGSTFGRGFLGIGLGIVKAVSLGVAVPYATNRLCQYDMEHISISGHPLIFGGSASKLFWRFILWLILSVFTVGIYAILVLPMNMQRYKVKFSRLRDMSYDPASDPR